MLAGFMDIYLPSRKRGRVKGNVAITQVRVACKEQATSVFDAKKCIIK